MGIIIIPREYSSIYLSHSLDVTLNLLCIGSIHIFRGHVTLTFFFLILSMKRLTGK